MLLAIAGYFVLTFMTFLLFGFSWYETFSHSAVVFFSSIQALVIGALVYESGREWLHSIVREKIRNINFGRIDIGNFFAVFAGTLITYFLSVNIGLGPVVAAGLVGVLATLVTPKFDVPLYCGAFAGMASNVLLPTFFHISLAGIIAGLVFVLTKPVFNGFGGKLGTIAFTGCVLAALLTGRELGSDPVPGWDIGRLLVFYSILGALITFILNERLRHSPVISSGIIGLGAGLLLPVLHPATGDTLAVMVICASFAGMSSIERIPNELYICIAGFICALIFIYSSPYLGGAGGKLGTIAFGSVISMRGIIDFTQQVKAKGFLPFTTARQRERSSAS